MDNLLLSNDDAWRDGTKHRRGEADQPVDSISDEFLFEELHSVPEVGDVKHLSCKEEFLGDA